MTTTPTEVQIINGPDGKPAFVVIPYEQYKAQGEADLIPHEVVSRIVDGATPIRAWREYLNLTQEEALSHRYCADHTIVVSEVPMAYA